MATTHPDSLTPFAPGKASDIPVDEAYAKLQNMARAAELLRSKHV